MRDFVLLLIVIAAARAASIPSDYLPSIADNSLSNQESIQPENQTAAATLAEDGYRYKVVRKLRQRVRRDVNELQLKEYLPPVAEVAKDVIASEPAVNEETSVVAAKPEEKTLLSEDGYRYKTVRRLKYRQRRDVNELPADKYLPPTEVKQSVYENTSAVESQPEVKTELADDGYHYKTIRRLKYRHRRDVPELSVNEYLPPVEIKENSSVVEAEPVVKTNSVSLVEPEPEVKTDLAEDGYRYKTVRRLKYRHRRDVNELPKKEYLPPLQVKENASEEVLVVEPEPEVKADSISLVEPEPEIKTDLAEDGYRYKTVRRLKYRQRRDVNELPSKEYLPPTEIKQNVPEEESVAESEPEAKLDLVSIVEPEPEVKTDLAEDGYRYKTIRRLKYRQRRDVNELPKKKYLPPLQVKENASEEVSVVEPEPEVKADSIPLVEEPEVKTDLAEDGYRYKTVRRLKYRQRRDVNELPKKKYLPPLQVKENASEEVSVVEPEPEVKADSIPLVEEPEVKTDLAEDGYRYKTVRRLKYRQRRDVNELLTKKYLPPTEVKQNITEEVASVEVEPEVKTDLAEDGYRYKTVRRLKYRQRRDVNELLKKKYLPPAETKSAASIDTEAVESLPEEKTKLANDGYHYKTVRRLKYRRL